MIKSICIFEDDGYKKLLPLTYMRPSYDLRLGIFTLRQKIERAFPKAQVALHTRDLFYPLLSEQNPKTLVGHFPKDDTLFINGRAILTPDLIKELNKVEKETLWVKDNTVVAAYYRGVRLNNFTKALEETPNILNFPQVPIKAVEVPVLRFLWEFIEENPHQLTRDFQVLRLGKMDSRWSLSRRGRDGNNKKGKNVFPGVQYVNKKEIVIENGSLIKPGVVLDAEEGPIYIGKNVRILANAVVMGPAYIGEGTLIKAGTKIYGGTSIGPVCKIGGEISESIIDGYANKQHDGFLGHSYLGPWTNLGAGTETSDLKNNYGSIRVAVNGEMIDSGSMFVGLFMGDHSKSGINTMFNSGTVVGVSSNVFGSGYLPKFIPSFCWGGSDKREYELVEALETARKVMERRNVKMTHAYEQLFRFAYVSTQKERL